MRKMTEFDKFNKMIKKQTKKMFENGSFDKLLENPVARELLTTPNLISKKRK